MVISCAEKKEGSTVVETVSLATKSSPHRTDSDSRLSITRNEPALLGSSGGRGRVTAVGVRYLCACENSRKELISIWAVVAYV